MHSNSKQLIALVYKYDKALQNDNIDTSNMVLTRIKELCSDLQVIYSLPAQIPGLEFIKKWGEYSIYYDIKEGKYYNQTVDLYLDDQEACIILGGK